MNKADLIESLESRLGSKKAASDAVEAVTDVIIREVAKGNKVGITGFGTFEKVSRAARTGRNPRTGETVKIKKTAVPKFKPGTAFKSVTSDPRKLPKTGNAGGRASAGTLATAGRKSATSKSTAKKTTAKKSSSTGTAKKATGAKSAASRSATKSAPARSTAKKTTAKPAAAKKSTATTKKAAAKKSTAKKATRR